MLKALRMPFFWDMTLRHCLNWMSMFRGSRERPPRLSLPVFMSLYRLLGVKQVQGIMFQVSRSVFVPNEKQKFVYSLFKGAGSS
jgi:hypothetical protein